MIFLVCEILRKFHIDSLCTLPVNCSHFTLGNPKKLFFNSIIHTYFRLFTLSQKKTKLLLLHLPHLKNVTTLPCNM